MSILVGYVPSPEGEAALDRAIAEAKRDETTLFVVNISKGDAYIDDRVLDQPQLASLDERLASASVEHEIVQVNQGHDAADEILRVAEEKDVDLVVIGLRRRSAVGKFLMGSTAQRILLHAECDVLSVKAPRTH